MQERKISIVTMLQGNVVALRKTLESFAHIADEYVLGDMMIFEEDREVVEQYKKDFNLRVIRLPFNFIFHAGFADTLNFLISNANNDLSLYTNVSEVIDEDYGIKEIVTENPYANAFYFTHRQEKHRWFRCLDRRFVRWSGMIHEDASPVIGEVMPHHKPIYMMKDEEKDMDDAFKAAVFNMCKELVYFSNYRKLVDYPKLIGATNEGWVRFATDEYESMKQRMDKRGKMLIAFQTGDFDLLKRELNTNIEFEKERFVSSHGMNFQGARKDIL